MLFDSHKDAPSGFALKIMPTGGKTFVLRYTIDGRQRLKVIGAFPAWSVEAARKEAQRLIREVDQGHDPLEEKRRRRLEPTLGELATEWLDKHVAGLKSADDVRRYVLKDMVPVLGKMKVSAIRRRDVLDLVEGKAATAPRAAAIVLRVARQLFTYAVDREVIPASPVADLKPSSIKTREHPRGLVKVVGERVLNTDEIKAFWNNVETSGMDRLTALALKMILITGQRPGEVAGMAWAEIDSDKWTIPAQRRGKTEQAHSVHLTATALAIIAEAKDEVARRQKRRGDGGGQFVFESRLNKPITRHALSRAVVRFRPTLGMKGEPWTPHDLRRTMRTGLSACKVRPDIAELTIGHTKRGIVAVYDRHGFEAERREALQTWETWLMQTVNDNVVSLADKRSSA